MENEKNVSALQKEEIIPDSRSAASDGKKQKKKSIPGRIILAVLGILLLALIITGVIIFYGPVSTIMSVTEIDDGIYSMNYNRDYDLDKALSADIHTEQQLMSFISDTLFYGLDVGVNQKYIACSAFLTHDGDGSYYAGRNFDYDKTEMLTVYTTPKDGYASIAMVPLCGLGIGDTFGQDPMSLLSRAEMLAAPYLCTDGMNEKGVMTSVLNLNSDELHTYSDKPDIITFVAIRMILDRAASVDEAVEMLSHYDFHSMTGVAQHLFISDASGRSVVVEWYKHNMAVIDSPVCTNFWLSSPVEYAGRCERFDTLTQRLEEKPVNTPEDAMDNLRAANVSWTQWSCVYHLSDFSVDIVIKNRYEKVYKVSPDKF